MSARTILTLANGKGADLLNLRPEDVDFAAFAEHLAKEKRFNGATPGLEYSVADHLVVGVDELLAAGGSKQEAAYFLLHDVQEGIWKDDPTPKKIAIAERIEERCGVVAEAILEVLEGIVSEHDAAIYQAAGVPYPVPEITRLLVKKWDVIMFVTEWRDLMGDIEHPHWAPYASVTPLLRRIVPMPWQEARDAWMLRARQLLPALGGVA